MGVMPQLSAKFPLLPSIPATGNTILPNTAHSATGSIAPSVGSMAHSQAVSSGTQVVVPAGMFLGEGLVPLPAKLVQRIICLEFVEMAELLPESWLAAESSDAEVSGHAKVVSIFPKRRRAPVTDVLVWVQCFSAMVGVLSTKYPDKVPEFMAYQALIVKCSRDYEGFGWVLYDRAFRRQVAVTRDLNWSKLNPTLHSLCMAGKARKNKFCALCLSDNHSSDQCPEAWQGLLPATYFGQHGPPPACPFPQPGLIPRLAGFGHPTAFPFGSPPVPVCRLFNKPEGPRCTFNPCKYAHVCALCKGQHARAECRARSGLTSAAKRPRLS